MKKLLLLILFSPFTLSEVIGFNCAVEIFVISKDDVHWADESELKYNQTLVIKH